MATATATAPAPPPEPVRVQLYDADRIDREIRIADISVASLGERQLSGST